MNPKDIEEIKGEFRMLVPDDDGSAMDWLENTLTTLTTKHQEELEKAVEAERVRIWKVASDARLPYRDSYADGVNATVKLIWEALGGKQDERGSYSLPTKTGKQ